MAKTTNHERNPSNNSRRSREIGKEYGKSSFLIDLVEHNSGSLYVEITQNIQNRENEEHSIRLNPSVIDDLVKVLKMYQAQIPATTYSQKSYLSKEVQQKIQERYLKGISIKDLAIQFDHSEELIKQILRNRGIQIVPFKVPRFWKKKRKR